LLDNVLQVVFIFYILNYIHLQKNTT
jgi:hypothetical protein